MSKDEYQYFKKIYLDKKADGGAGFTGFSRKFVPKIAETIIKNNRAIPNAIPNNRPVPNQINQQPQFPPQPPIQINKQYQQPPIQINQQPRFQMPSRPTQSSINLNSPVGKLGNNKYGENVYGLNQDKYPYGTDVYDPSQFMTNHVDNNNDNSINDFNNYPIFENIKNNIEEIEKNLKNNDHDYVYSLFLRLVEIKNIIIENQDWYENLPTSSIGIFEMIRLFRICENTLKQHNFKLWRESNLRDKIINIIKNIREDLATIAKRQIKVNIKYIKSHLNRIREKTTDEVDLNSSNQIIQNLEKIENKAMIHDMLYTIKSIDEDLKEMNHEAYHDIKILINEINFIIDFILGK